MKKLALIGSETFAHQIRQFAEATGDYIVVGYFDDFKEKCEIEEGLPILGKISEIEELFSQQIFDYIFFAAGYNNFSFRCSVFESLKGKVPFANIIMPAVSIGKDVILGEGIFLGGSLTIGDESVIEDNVFIHGYSYIGHNNIIGAHTYISGRFDSAGFVHVGKCNFIGIRVLIADHISICDNAWIGLGCVVAKNISRPGKYMSTAAKLYQIE